MQEALEFVRSDGDSSHWPICEQLAEGDHWERLESDDHLAQYLRRLSKQLNDTFGQQRNSLLLLSFLPTY